MNRLDFAARLRADDLEARPSSLRTIQINLTRLCNQACRHCHVDASPKRREAASEAVLDRIIALLEEYPAITTLDITGGAPELHPGFEDLVRRAVALRRHVMVRHNLTVTLDPHPLTGASLEHLPQFFAETGVEVVSSLPYYQEYFTDKQRGNGVFDKSIESLLRLNAVGFGMPDAGRELSLVYNPVGAFLPADQASLEADYRRELRERFGIEFTRLYAIANMPINRFRADLERRGQLDAYLEKLADAFNPEAVSGLMCRDMVSVDHDGRVYDCDFNQQLGMSCRDDAGGDLTIFDLEPGRFIERDIRFDDHCFGCTAGAGSSCGGATA